MGSVISVEQRTNPWLVEQTIRTEAASLAAHESQKIASLSAVHADGKMAARHARKLECVIESYSHAAVLGELQRYQLIK